MRSIRLLRALLVLLEWVHWLVQCGFAHSGAPGVQPILIFRSGTFRPSRPVLHSVAGVGRDLHQQRFFYALLPFMAAATAPALAHSGAPGVMSIMVIPLLGSAADLAFAPHCQRRSLCARAQHCRRWSVSYSSRSKSRFSENGLRSRSYRERGLISWARALVLRCPP